MARGGKREGAGRPLGSKVTKNTTMFYVRCSEEEKQKLKKFLEKLRSR